MAIIASGMYGLTLEKIFIDTAGQSLEAETHKGLLVTDTYNPNFDTHAFRSDVTNEIAAGGGYTTGGNTLTTTEVVVGSPSVGVLKYDHDDVQWSSSTITAAMALIGYFNVGTAGTDMLVYLLDFVTSVTTSSGLLLVQINSNGVFNADYTP